MVIYNVFLHVTPHVYPLCNTCDTGYKLYYYAASEADEQGKQRVSVTLNRGNEWNCTPLKGSSTAYEFIGLPLSVDAKYQIALRFLPCPCLSCFNADYNSCSNKHIVGDMEADYMYFIPPSECPDMLNIPLSDYTIAVLEAFIKLHLHKLPKKKKKTDLIAYITNDIDLRMLINYGDDI